MEGFKRNQVEEAIALQFGRSRPDTELRTRLKRLLDTDRNLPLPQRSAIKHAFYSEKGPGRGNEVFFSEYEAFALSIALRLLNHNWTQQIVVKLLRDARQPLAYFHRQILLEDPTDLFDPSKIARQRERFLIWADNSRPTFLLIVSDSGAPPGRGDADELQTYVFRATEADAFSRKKLGRSTTFLELVTAAHKLHDALLSTEPAKRGRT